MNFGTLREYWRKIGRADETTGFLLRGSAVSLAARVTGILLSYGSTVILSRSLGVEKYGLYALALSWVLVLVLPARAGLDIVALRFASIYLDERRMAFVRGFVRLSATAVFFLSVLIGAAMYILSRLGVTNISPSLALPASTLIFPLAALGLTAALLRSAKRIFAAQFYDQILRPLLLIGALGALLFSGKSISPATGMIVTSASALAALVFAAAHLNRALQDPGREVAFGPWRQWVSFSIPLLMISVVQELLNQLDIIMLGYLDGAASAGLFSAAWRLASLVTFGLAAIVTMSGPLIAAAHARGDKPELHHIARMTARFGFAAGTMMVLPLALGGQHILRLFGPGFENAYPALLVLLIGGLGNAFTGSVAYFMTMTGRHIAALWTFIGALAVSATLNLLLIPHFSIGGAAIASSSATLFWNFVMLAYVRRNLGIDASAVALPPRTVAGQR